MYAFIRGKLVESSLNHVVLEASGIGFYIYTPVHLASKLPNPGNEVAIYTSFVIRENSQALYGFWSPSEKACFEIFLNVSGVGPKLALSLVGHMSMDDLASAISEKDTGPLCRVPGVGKKTAERLLVELKDKLPSLSSHSPKEFQIDAALSDSLKDGISALVNLGYHPAAAQKAIKKAIADDESVTDLGALVTKALKSI